MHIRPRLIHPMNPIIAYYIQDLNLQGVILPPFSSFQRCMHYLYLLHTPYRYEHVVMLGIAGTGSKIHMKENQMQSMLQRHACHLIRFSILLSPPVSFSFIFKCRC